MSDYMKEILDCPGLGVSVTVQSIADTFNDWGDVTGEVTTNFSFTAQVQVLTGDDDHVQEGILNAGDIEVYFNPSDSNISAVKRSNRILIDTDNDSTDETYEIINVIHEPSVNVNETHIMVLARRL